MRTLFIPLFILGLLPVYLQILPRHKGLEAVVQMQQNRVIQDPELQLKQVALEVLKTKCNVCHRKKNPFRIFSLKNMDRHAPRIYKQVFIFKRMPKGDQIKLTGEDYQSLKHWLKSKNIY